MGYTSGPSGTCGEGPRVGLTPFPVRGRSLSTPSVERGQVEPWGSVQPLKGAPETLLCRSPGGRDRPTVVPNDGPPLWGSFVLILHLPSSPSRYDGRPDTTGSIPSPKGTRCNDVVEGRSGRRTSRAVDSVRTPNCTVNKGAVGTSTGAVGTPVSTATVLTTFLSDAPARRRRVCGASGVEAPVRDLSVTVDAVESADRVRPWQTTPAAHHTDPAETRSTAIPRPPYRRRETLEQDPTGTLCLDGYVPRVWGRWSLKSGLFTPIIDRGVMLALLVESE